MLNVDVPESLAAPTQREVKCHHCTRAFRVAETMRSTICPHCGRHVCLDDLVATKRHVAGTLATCGKLIVEAKSQLTMRAVAALEGVEIRGRVEGNVNTPGAAVVGPTARIKGNIAASSIVIEPGAVIEGGYLEIRPRGGSAA